MPRVTRVLLILAVLVTACNIERRHVIGPESNVSQVVVMPDTITIDPLGVWTFGVYGRTAAGDSIPVSVQWSASAGEITPSAFFTADSSENDVTVTAALSNSPVGTIPLTGSAVVHKRRVIQLMLRPGTATLLPGQTLQFATRGVRNSGDTVSVSATYVATGGTITSSGLYTAGATAGTFMIIATRRALADTVTVTITTPVPIATVTVSPASSNLNVGATVQLTATTKDSVGNVLTGRSVAWSSSAPGVATVSASGLVTGVAAGSATITATSEGQSGTSTITVTFAPVASVTVAPATKTLRIATTVQLSATIKDSTGAVLTGRSISWSSDAPAVATVSSSGLVSAGGVGSATITATSEGKSGTALITVTVIPVATVTVTPSPGSVNMGSTLQLTAVTKDSAGRVLTGRVVTWSSSAVGVGTVSSSGLVSGIAAGPTTITATSEGQSGSSVVTVIDPLAVRAGKYVSASGSSAGDGTIGRPWDLATALSGAGGRIVPGDTIWLRGGTYQGSFTSSLRGTAAAPIVVRQYPGERATLDGTTSSVITLNVDGAWTVYWGFEIMNTILTRFGSGLAARPSGVYVRNASNVRLVNLIIHDTGHGTYIENTAHNIEIYGWIVYNGGNDNPTRSDGHGIYVRNDGTTPKLIAENVIFNQFGFGIHSYAEGGDLLKRITFEGNVLFNNGTLSAFNSPNMILGGETSADMDTVRNNMLYFAPGRGPRNMRLGYTTQLNSSAVFEGNYVVGGTAEAVDITYWQNLVFRNNTLVETGRVLAFGDSTTASYGWSANTHYRDPAASAWGFRGTDHSFSSWRQATGLGGTDQAIATTPTTPAIFVRPNKYEPGRANIIVYNWGRQPSVSVDLSNVLTAGQKFEIRNVQDIFGAPVVSGVYGGGSVSIPMNGVTPPQPIGGSPTAPMRTGPDFDVFVVVRVS